MTHDSALRLAVGHAVRAPSSHNTQPWRFRLRDRGIDLYGDRTRRLPVVDPDGRELAMSCGAALFHLECALEHLGYGVDVQLLPDATQPDLFARVDCRPGAPTAASEPALFTAIPLRHTSRRPFLPDGWPGGLAGTLRSIVASEACRLTFVPAGPERAALADLVAQGDRLQFGDPAFRRELAAWLRPKGSRAGDGLRGDTLGLGKVTSHAAPRLIRALDLGRAQAAVDRKRLLAAPAVAILATERDDPRSWLAAGRALAHLLLRAALDGVSAGYLNQPVQCAALRPQVARRLDAPGYPQLVMRFGRARPGQPSDRRPLDDVVS